MSEKEPHSERQRSHEALYRKTVRQALFSIEFNQFTERGAAMVLEQLRTELGQCIELLLISPEFYAEQMELLQGKVTQAMES